MAVGYVNRVCTRCDNNFEHPLTQDGKLWKWKYDGFCQRCSRLESTRKANAKRYVPAPWPHEERNCGFCGLAFTATTATTFYCTPKCQYAGKRKRQREENPGAYFGARRARDSKRRALKRTTQIEKIIPREVFEREGYVCHICQEPTSSDSQLAQFRQDPKAPELEHIVSLNEGGAHVWSNVACSCRACNARKGSKSFGQLHLPFGPKRTWPELSSLIVL